MKKNFTSNEDQENIYSKIIDKEYTKFKFNKIVLGTKKLISNNINFKDYSKEYEEITKITTFKNPDEEYFPLLKNEEFVSLCRTKYSYDSRKNKLKKNSIYSSKPKIKKFSLRIKNIKRKNNEKMSINKNTVFSSQDDTYKNKKIINKLKIKIKNDNISNQINNYLSEQSNANKNIININSEINSSIFSNMKEINNYNSNNNKDIILSPLSNSTTTQTSFFNKNKKINIMNKSIDHYNHIKNRNIFTMKNNLTSLFNQKKKLYNNRILLRDILLQEKDYFSLHYDEKKIFLSPEHYNEYIKEQVMIIKKNKIKIEHPEKFEKIYENSKFDKPKLTLNSIIIEFKQKYSFDNKYFNLNDNQIFNIPFEYIPIFYYNKLEKLKEILVSIFYMDENFTKFFLKLENLGYILRNSEDFSDKNENNKDNKKDVYKKAFTYKLQLSHSQTLNKNNNFFKSIKKSSIMKNKDFFELIDIFNTEYNFNKYPKYLQNRNNDKIYNNNKNIFEFIWLTPSFQYLATLKTPEICFKINGIEIRKNINIELLLFLSENNFKNWDFYVMEYLFSYYDFTIMISSFFSRYKSKSKLMLNSNYNVKNNIIYLTREKKSKYSIKLTKLEYIFTNENLNNYIKILHNYKLFVFNKKINPYFQFCFHLNFKQMKALYLASKKQGIKYILEKLIIMDKDNMKIKLNYEYLNNFCKNDLNNLEPLVPSNVSIKANKYNFNINDSKFCLFYPILETIKFNENSQRKDNCFQTNLENEIKNGMNMNILDSLFKNNDVYKWPSIIEFIDNQEKLKKQKKRTSITSILLPKFHIDIINNKILNSLSTKKLNILDIDE